MSDTSAVNPAFESYSNDYAKQQQQGLDFFSFHSPSDILAPHPDLFESDLDSSLAAFDQVQLQLLTVDSNDAYSFLRSDTPTCGPPSTITLSSESAYDSLSSHSESFYNYPTSPYDSSNYSFPLDLEMDFQKFRVDSVSDYGAALPTSVDPSSFGALPPTPPRSPEMAAASPGKGYAARSSYSDYGPSSNSGGSDYYNHLGYTSVSPSSVSPVPSIMPLARSGTESDDSKADPRKKYKCNTCPRAFARAYNLKTHMATHDPNRLKPHVCPARSCGRSFSRKHDLARHQISLHGGTKADKELAASPYHSANIKRAIGVDRAPRSWCDGCGRGFIGRARECDCEGVAT